jgi:hypothetical protein
VGTDGTLEKACGLFAEQNTIVGPHPQGISLTATAGQAIARNKVIVRFHVDRP